MQVYKLVAKGTIEEKILDLQEKKAKRGKKEIPARTEKTERTVWMERTVQMEKTE